MNALSSYKKVISNPFSTASAQPKIPDGSVPASMGAKRNLVGELEFGAYGVWDIIISPRYDSPIYVATAAQTAGAPAAGTTPATNGGPKLDNDYAMADNHPINNAYIGVSDSVAKAIPTSEVSKIRMVSQGTKITLTNSTDDNDGWFEAFRFTPHKDQNTYSTAKGVAGQTYATRAKVVPDMFGNREFSTANDFKMNLASKSNYTTGKLRNLHRYTWVNKPCTKEVEFKDLPSSLLVYTGVSEISQQNTWASIALQDWDYDVIWIRVHGRGIAPPADGSTPTGCCLPTKLMFHLVQNVECVFGEQNLLHSYMSKSVPMYSNRMTRSMTRRNNTGRTYRKKKTLKLGDGYYYLS